MIDVHGLADQVVSAGLLSDVLVIEAGQLRERWAGAHRVVAGIEGLTTHEGQDFMIRVGLTRNFPYELPVVFSLDSTHCGRIPHVFADGYVCYREIEGLLLDPYDPVGIIRFALLEALQILVDGLSRRNIREFVEELTLYWPGAQAAVNLFEPGEDFAKIGSFQIAEGLRGIARNQEERVEALLSRVPMFREQMLGPLMRLCAGALVGESWESGIYIPLDVPVSFPASFRDGGWTLEQVARFVRRGLSKKRQGRLDRMTRRAPQASCFTILGVPRDRGEPNLVGIRFTEVRGGHPLGRSPSQANVTPFRLHRFDQRYLKARSGARNLGGVRVLLVGCGAVGGHVGMEMARCGVGHIDLVDPDVLSAENAFRHVLGTPSSLLPMGKATLLASTISQKYPSVSTSAKQSRVEDVLAEGLLELADYSLIIMATGDHNVDRMVNAQLFSRDRRCAILYTWLEPLGIGGHALLDSSEKKPGCFECLFTSHPADASPQLCNRAAFTAAGQVFTRELAGCGNAFTPYSSLDAMRTAELAVRVAVSALTRELEGPLLRSWKGTADGFRREGYQTSERFESTSDELGSGRADFCAEQCRICGTAPR